MNDQLEAFVRFSSLLTREDGSSLRIEQWQIEVVADLLDAKEGVLTVPKGNGKTSLLAALALYHLLTTPNASAYIAAASRDQATILYNSAAGYVRRSRELQGHLTIKSGYRRIRSVRDDGFIQVLAADADTADGVAPSLALVDELHRHRNGEMYSVLRDGAPKRDGAVWTISTAGFDEDSPLGRLRNRALSLPDVRRDGAHVVARSDDGRFVYHEWSVPVDADVTEMAMVKAANPLSMISVESLKARFDSPSMRELAWRRFSCNQWTRTETEIWIAPGPWDACRADSTVPRGSSVVLALDGSYNGDTTALMGCTIGHRPHLFVVGLWAPSDGQTVPILEVEDTIADACRLYAVREITADPYRWQRTLAVLAERRLPISEFPQTPTRMVPATSRLFEAVMNETVTHDGNESLRRHVLNAIVRDRGHGLMIAKESRKTTRKIDLAAAAIMAFERAHHYAPGPRKVLWAPVDVFGPDRDTPIDDMRERARRDSDERVTALADMLGISREELLADA
jgi:phage terminase large subunit-like protein